MNHTTGGFELVLSPLLLGLVGYGLDRLWGLTPVLTVIAAVLGLAGAVTKLVIDYSNNMGAEEHGAPWSPRR